MKCEILPGFFTETECLQLIELVGKPAAIKKVGNDKNKKDALIESIRERVASATGFPPENQEPVQIAHYHSSQYYKEHSDPFPPNWPDFPRIEKSGGNRVMTFMIYLNTVPVGYGGETVFGRVGLSVRPEMGKALLWLNLSQDGTIDDFARHEAKAPLKPYDKWIASIWIREREYQDIGPYEPIYADDEELLQRSSGE